MNKTLIAMVLLGLVVVAMAGEVKEKTKSAKMDKMRLKKAKLMAKKEKMSLDKVKKSGMGDGALPFDRPQPAALPEKEAFKQKYESMKEQVKSGAMTSEEFKRNMRLLKDEAKRSRGTDKSEASRNKRSVKKTARKMTEAVKSKINEKKRRSPKA